MQKVKIDQKFQNSLINVNVKFGAQPVRTMNSTTLSIQFFFLKSENNPKGLNMYRNAGLD